MHRSISGRGCRTTTSASGDNSGFRCLRVPNQLDSLHFYAGMLRNPASQRSDHQFFNSPLQRPGAQSAVVTQLGDVFQQFSAAFQTQVLAGKRRQFDLRRFISFSCSQPGFESLDHQPKQRPCASITAAATPVHSRLTTPTMLMAFDRSYSRVPDWYWVFLQYYWTAYGLLVPCRTSRSVSLNLRKGVPVWSCVYLTRQSPV